MRYIGLMLHVATAMLVTLKLVGALAWPWLWVLSPSICALGLGGIFMLVAGGALLLHKICMRDPAYRTRHALGELKRAVGRR